jgi:hypothetical protein
LNLTYFRSMFLSYRVAVFTFVHFVSYFCALKNIHFFSLFKSACIFIIPTQESTASNHIIKSKNWNEFGELFRLLSLQMRLWRHGIKGKFVHKAKKQVRTQVHSVSRNTNSNFTYHSHSTELFGKVEFCPARFLLLITLVCKAFPFTWLGSIVNNLVCSLLHFDSCHFGYKSNCSQNYGMAYDSWYWLFWDIS